MPARPLSAQTLSAAAAPAGVRAGLLALLSALEHALRVGRPLGEYAVPGAVLLHNWLAPGELDRLVAEGLVRWHGAGADAPAAGPRLAACDGEIGPTPHDGYVLTAAGLAALFALLPQPAGAELPGPTPAPADAPAGRRPVWRAAARELWWGSLLVKRVRHDAANQGRVLQAFEDQGWPPRIDDPLPALAGAASKARLHETLRGLHRGQRPFVLRFAADGAGLGIRWAAVV